MIRLEFTFCWGKESPAKKNVRKMSKKHVLQWTIIPSSSFICHKSAPNKLRCADLRCNNPTSYRVSFDISVDSIVPPQLLQSHLVPWHTGSKKGEKKLPVYQLISSYRGHYYVAKLNHALLQVIRKSPKNDQHVYCLILPKWLFSWPLS